MAVHQIRKLLFLPLFFLFVFQVSNTYAQSNHLNKRITVSLNNETAEQTLASIAKKGGFSFSYNADIINANQRVSVNAKNKSVNKILKDAFADTYRYKAVGNHVIMMENVPNVKPSKADRDRKYVISGSIIDSRTGERITQATIYEVDGRIVSVTNEEGDYTLELPAIDNELGINFSKKGYLDTVIIVRPMDLQEINIDLKPREYNLEKIASKEAQIDIPDIHTRKVVSWVVPEESKTISDNLEIYDTKAAQISFLPYLGSNHKVSGSVNNVFSLNVLAGYSAGVRGLELGGILNINRQDMIGAQVSGIGNFVGGKSQGVQLAGITNVNNGTFRGVQTAGLSNMLLDTLTGVQVAGIQNILKGEMKGWQLSGISNVSTKSVDGVQLTGIANIAFNDVNLAQISGVGNYAQNIEGVQLGGIVNAAIGDVNKLQVAGVANFCKNVGGAQLSGILNVAYGDVNTAQISGIANLTNNIEGMQIAGIANGAYGDVNRAQIAGIANAGRNVHGLQIAGIANAVYDENTSGQIAGIANYANKVEGIQLAGYGNIALSEVEGAQVSTFLNFTQKLNGIQLAFCNISDTVEKGTPIGFFSFVLKGYHKPEVAIDETKTLSLGFKTGVRHFYNIFQAGISNDRIISGTYGLGTSFTLKKRWGMNIDGTASWMFNSNANMENIGTLFRLKPTVDYQIFNSLTIFAGPSFNTYVSNVSQNNQEYIDISFHPFYDKISGDNRIQMWIGLSAGLRF